MKVRENYFVTEALESIVFFWFGFAFFFFWSGLALLVIWNINQL